jgi:hypothetical protein
VEESIPRSANKQSSAEDQINLQEQLWTRRKKSTYRTYRKETIIEAIEN